MIGALHTDARHFSTSEGLRSAQTELDWSNVLAAVVAELHNYRRRAARSLAWRFISELSCGAISLNFLEPCTPKCLDHSQGCFNDL
jgi:hypothetical protein